MSRKEAVLSMHQILIKRRDALRKALAGDLSLLKELRAQSSGDVVDAALEELRSKLFAADGYAALARRHEAMQGTVLEVVGLCKQMARAEEVLLAVD